MIEPPWPSSASLPGEDPLDLFQRVARDVVARNPGATLEELNAALELERGRYNARPQTQLGGLSPGRLQRLLDDDWSGSGVLRIREDLPAAELEATPLLHDALDFLRRVAGEPPKLTPAGNLPRAFVAAHRAEMRMPHWLHGSERAVLEQDLFPLHYLRVHLQVAGLLRRFKGTLRTTPAARDFVRPERHAALFTHLFRTWFRRLNLAYVDGAPAAPAFQQTIAFTLHRFQELAGDWHSTKELVGACLLPVVREQLPLRRYSTAPDDRAAYLFDEAVVPLENRCLEALVNFGLAETEQDTRTLHFDRRRWRKTPLLDGFLRFEW